MTPHSLDRRRFLGSATLACAGWVAGLQNRFASGKSNPRARAKRVVMVFHCGGPSQLDLWDPKPNAPKEIRGPFSTISTSIPGLRFSELLPQLALEANQLAWIPTVNHRHTQHNSGMYWTLTGRPYRLDSTLIHPGPTDHPSLGTLINHLTQNEPKAPGTASYVITPFPSCDSYVYLTPGQFGGSLGRQADPFVLNLDPSIPLMKNPFPKSTEPKTTPGNDRLALWRSLEKAGGDFSRIKTEASRFLGDSPLRQASRLELEPDRVREAYGKNPWGDAHLLARRLLESGTRFVSVVNGPGIVWDTHKNNFETHKKRLVPPMEKAMVSLIRDLKQRGLWEETLLLSLADFGRTPKINTDAGRDHWPQCFTAILGGGAITPGAIYGQSDKTGSYPRDLPVSPADIHATVLAAMGFDPENLILQAQDGRPFAATEGRPLQKLLA